MTQKLCRTPAVYTRYRRSRDYTGFKYFLFVNSIALAFVVAMALLIR